MPPPATTNIDDPAVHTRRWGILAVLCVVLLVVVIDNTILNVALPDIQRQLGATQTQEQWFLDAYTLTFAALLFTFGVLGDRYGRRRALITGFFVFGVASVLSAFAVNPAMLIATRALMAVGGAAVLPATLSTINVVFDPAERGRAIGIWAGVSGAGHRRGADHRWSVVEPLLVGLGLLGQRPARP